MNFCTFESVQFLVLLCPAEAPILHRDVQLNSLKSYWLALLKNSIFIRGSWRKQTAGSLTTGCGVVRLQVWHP